MNLCLTKTQLGYYFMPRDLQYFAPDFYIDYGNNYISKVYSLQSIRSAMIEYDVELREFSKPNNKRKQRQIYDYLS